ncbi:MAG: Gfo/Idh/MocA family oxidoreductase [Bacteroidota bacterium]|nr:Gfo/Idh/MocA family oxidoreductase [Bacteroidota bacterium]MDX5505999.1 Gfo/Idh/MocA family oxidoreductase [Bacteroidota bacterium]
MRLKIGVLGAGHLGKIHLKCISQLSDNYELIGFFDPNSEVSAKVASELGYRAFDSVEDLIEACDVVDIVTPTLSHFDCAVKALRARKHLFVEKPITHTLDEAKQLIKLADEAGVHAQVGHVERFNPAFSSAEPHIKNPMFIEAHRLAEFNPRGTDVSVVMDLMIHDIDIVLSLVPSNIKKISASGVAVVSETADIANARIEFDNGCVANLTASRISLKNMRKMRLFQRDAYITVDFLDKGAEVLRMNEVQGDIDPYAMVLDLPNGTKKQISFENPEVRPNNAIKDELESLSKSIRDSTTVNVSLEDGMRALEVAQQITEKLNISINLLA